VGVISTLLIHTRHNWIVTQAYAETEILNSYQIPALMSPLVAAGPIPGYMLLNTTGQIQYTGVLVVTIWLELCTSWLQLSPPTPSSVASTKSRMEDILEDILVPANPGPPGKWPIKRRDRDRERRTEGRTDRRTDRYTNRESEALPVVQPTVDWESPAASSASASDTPGTGPSDSAEPASAERDRVWPWARRRWRAAWPPSSGWSPGRQAMCAPGRTPAAPCRRASCQFPACTSRRLRRSRTPEWSGRHRLCHAVHCRPSEHKQQRKLTVRFSRC